MSTSGDSFSFNSNEYVRPNDQWVCGGAADGVPCPRGPSSDGQCGAPCQPHKIGDRYFCDNAAVISGRCDDGPTPEGECCHFPALCTPAKAGDGYLCRLGACAEGPMPDGACSRACHACSPKRTIASQRRLFVALAGGLALGVSLLILFAPGMAFMASPGGLATPHQAFANDCSYCHAEGDDGSFTTDGIALAGIMHEQQDALCLDCHSEFSDFHDSPHTLDPEALALVSSETPNEPHHGDALLMASRSMFGANQELHCAACHQEHNGASHNLTKLADDQCQSCHSRVFHSFEVDHPPFDDYPLRRRAEIYFDHASHYGVHFANFKRSSPDGVLMGEQAEIKAAASDTCVHCHKVDDSGAYMVTLGYERMCASCHEAQIVDGRVPAMPALAQLSFDARPQLSRVEDRPAPFKIPPIMLLLLAADENFRAAYPAVYETDWPQKTTASEQQADDLDRIAQATEDLLADLDQDTASTITERLQAVCGDHLSEEEIKQLTRHTASSPFKVGVNLLLANLQAESNPQEEAAPQPAMPEEVSGWHFDKAEARLVYRPREHADSFLVQWIEAAAKLATTDESGEQAADIARQAVVDHFLNPTSAGRCTKCHTLDQSDDIVTVNWSAVSRSAGKEGLTKFRHAPHVTFLPGEDLCGACHVMDQQIDMYREEFFVAADRPNLDSSATACSGFSQIEGAEVCSKCHKTAGASQSCVTCHNYHGRELIPTR